MNKKNAVGVLVFSLFFYFVLGCIFAPNSLAGGWVGTAGFKTGKLSHNGGGSCNGDSLGKTYLLECTGYSWIYYKATDAAKDNKVDIFITPGQDVYSAKIPASCIDYGGFWHLGRNAQGITHSSYWSGIAYFGDTNFVKGISSDFYTYGTGRGNWGHMDTLNVNTAQGYNWAKYQSKTGLKQDLYAGDVKMYEATQIASSMDGVLDDYRKAAKRAGISIGENDYYPGDLYAFCSSGPKATYATKSNVSIRNNKSGESVWDTTGIKDSGMPIARVEGSFFNDEKATVTFSHNVYASEELDKGQWTIDRDYGESSGRSLVVILGGEEQGENDLDVWVDPYYTAYNVYDEDGNGYVARDIYEITFGNITEEKEYEICEIISFHDNDATSMACANITVKPTPPEKKYFAKSNTSVVEVGNSDNYSFATTNITQGSMNERAEIKIQKGKTAKVIFSHNAYLNAFSNENVGLKLERSNSLSSGTGYNFKSRTECDSGGKASFTLYDIYSGYFMGDPRECSDGVWLYTYRDIYNIEFTVDGTYDFCETFSVNGNNITRICSRVIVGSGDPHHDDPPTDSCPIANPASGASASVDSGTSNTTSAVVNHDVSKWSSWSSSHAFVYAKPGDKVQFKHCLYSGAQAVRNSSFHANHSEPHSYDGVTISSSNGDRTVITAGVNQMVVNKFNLWSDRTFTYTAGEVKTYVETSGDYTVKTSDVGKEGSTNGLYQTSYAVKGGAKAKDGTIHSWSWSWKCPPCTTNEKTGKTTCSTCRGSGSHTNRYYVGEITKGESTKRTATVHVPYNFINQSEIQLSGNYVYAGETAKFSKALVTTYSTRYNKETDGTYATVVPESKVRFVTYISTSNRTGNGGAHVNVSEGSICNSVFGGTYEQCNIGGGEDTTLNPSGKTNGDTKSYIGRSVNVHDADAGKYFCVALAVWPYTVKSDTVVDSKDFKEWYVSKASCKIIAKKPTFQVLGGSLYSAGKIQTNAGVKDHLNNIHNYETAERNHVTVFGSWVEQGVLALGSVSELASGAATGLNLINSGSRYDGSYEGYDVSYCEYRVPLSFANYSSVDSGFCKGTGSGYTGKILGGTSGGSAGAANTDKPGAVADYWLNKVNSPIKKSGGTKDISNSSNYEAAGSTVDIGAGTMLRYTYSDGDLTLTAVTIPTQITHIVKARNITISGDLTYDKGSEIELLSYIPKLVIYAQGNININCSVGNIDAVLIADGTINTCSGYSQNSNQNATARSKQLVINGVVVADKIEFNRTYGAATGTNSGTPAEIINYDVSSILWGRYVAGSSQSNNLTMTYQHELAPRL